jgi:hypothetical protein
VAFFHTQHIELNFKGYFRDGDSLVLAENGRSCGSFTFDKELGNIYNIILWNYKNFIINSINISLLSVFTIPKYGVGGVIYDNTTLAYIVQPTYGVGHSLFLSQFKIT